MKENDFPQVDKAALLVFFKTHLSFGRPNLQLFKPELSWICRYLSPNCLVIFDERKPLSAGRQGAAAGVLQEALGRGERDQAPLLLARRGQVRPFRFFELPTQADTGNCSVERPCFLSPRPVFCPYASPYHIHRAIG